MQLFRHLPPPIRSQGGREGNEAERTEAKPNQPDVVGSALDYLTGTWSAEEADRIDRALEDFGSIDEGMWE